MEKVIVTKNGVLVCCGILQDDGYIEVDGEDIMVDSDQIKNYTITSVVYFPGEKVDVWDKDDGRPCGVYVYYGENDVVFFAGNDGWDKKSFSIRPHVSTVKVTVELTSQEQSALIANAEKCNNDSDAWLSAVAKLAAAVKETKNV